MKVSIVIPAHNEEQTIRDTLTAVCNQQYPDFEVIVVDNGSSDRTQDIIRSFSNVRLVKESQKGTLFARERGRREAQGSIIANVDADCVPDSQWIQKGARYFQDPNVAGVTGPCDYYDASPFFRWLFLFTQRFVYRGMSALFQLPFIHRGAIMFGGNAFMRADALEKAGGYDTSFVFYGDDTDTAKRLLAFGKVLFKNDVVMKTSVRRFEREGILKTTSVYAFHFFRVVFRRDSL